MNMTKEFLLGASTAAYQVEGNNIYSDFWIQENLEHSSFIEKSGDAVDHYHCFKEDIELMKKAGLNAYRFSIEWGRIEPEEGKYSQEAVQHYREVLKCCRENGIEPVVTLHHFSSPAWLIRKGGWTGEYVVSAFANYAAYIIKELGDEIEYVCTINEANMGYQLGKITEDMLAASNRKEGDVQVGVNFDMEQIRQSMMEQGEAFQCDPMEIHTFLSPRKQEEENYVMRGHQAAKAAIKAVKPECKVGLTLSLFDYQIEPGGEKMAEKLWYDDFGFYQPFIKEDDFIGVQNYTRKIVSAEGRKEPEEGAPVTQMGYEDYPQSIGNVVRKVASEFDGEILVTENGIATENDERRCSFIREAMDSIRACISEGIPVKGYLHWSLLDNFEWQAGYGKTFGLIAVDRSTQTRFPKKSLSVLGSMQI